MDGVERVRLSSLEPELLTDEDIARMAASKEAMSAFSPVAPVRKQCYIEAYEQALYAR